MNSLLPFIGVLLLAMVTACSGEPQKSIEVGNPAEEESVPTMLTYLNQKFGIELGYPSSWQISGQGEDNVQFDSALGNADILFSDYAGEKPSDRTYREGDHVVSETYIVVNDVLVSIIAQTPDGTTPIEVRGQKHPRQKTLSIGEPDQLTPRSTTAPLKWQGATPRPPMNGRPNDAGAATP